MQALALKITRVAALIAALSSLSLTASANEPSVRSTDIVEQALATTGWLPVKSVGPYVEIGSYRIWVSTHLGKPASILPDGTWVYHGFKTEESNAEGALLVRFKQGRVNDLRLVSAAVLTALSTRPAKAAGALVAQGK
jgi:hypothetical protein